MTFETNIVVYDINIDTSFENEGIENVESIDLSSIDFDIEISFIEGIEGKAGTNGNGISNIQLISTIELVKTYRITFTNNTTFEFSITDGQNGTNGTNGVGITSITLFSTVGLIKTYRILFTNSTTFDFVVTDGDGANISFVVDLVSITTVPVWVDGDKWYNASTKKIWENVYLGSEESANITDPELGKAYQFNDLLYKWNGTDLIKFGEGSAPDITLDEEPTDTDTALSIRNDSWLKTTWLNVYAYFKGKFDLVYQAKGNYLTTETDPTVPSWAKASTKPSYTYTEVGAQVAKGSDELYVSSSEKSTWDGKSTAPNDSEKNIIVGVQQNGTDLTPDLNRKVNVVVPTQASDIGAQPAGTYSTDIHSNITALNAVTNVNTGDEVHIGETAPTGNEEIWIDPTGDDFTTNDVPDSTGKRYVTDSQLANINIIVFKPYAAKTANYTLLSTDYLVECTANSFTILLPTAVGITGKIYHVKNTGTGIITIDADGSQTIDGATTQTINQYENLTIMSNGANWIII